MHYQKIENKLQEYQKYIEKEIVTDFKIGLENFYYFYKLVYELLIKKGLIKEDVYYTNVSTKEVDYIMVLSQPDKESYETRAKEFFSIEYAKIKYSLEYSLTIISENVSNLKLKDLKKLYRLIQYIDWNNISTLNENYSTIFFAQCITKIKNSNDTLSYNILQDSIKQCIKYEQEAFENIKKIMIFKKEMLKVEIAKKYMDENQNFESLKDFLKKMRQLILSDKKKSVGYSEELLKEIYEETYGDNKETARLKVENELELIVRNKLKDENEIENSSREMLFEGFKEIGLSLTFLIEIMELLKISKGFLTKKKSALEKIMSKKSKEDEDSILAIRLNDRTTKVNFIEFANKINNMYSIYHGVLKNNMKKLREQSNLKLYLGLEKYVTNMKKVQDIFYGLEEFFNSKNIQSQFSSHAEDLRTRLSKFKRHIETAERKLDEYKFMSK